MTPAPTPSPGDERKSDKVRRKKSVVKNFVIPLLTVALSIGGSYFVSNHTVRKEAQEFISREKNQGQVVYDNIALQYFSSLSDLTDITENEKKQKTLIFKTDNSSPGAYATSYLRTLNSTLDYIDWVIKNPLVVEDKSKVVRLSHLRNYILLEFSRALEDGNTTMGPSQEVISFMCDLLRDSTTLQALIENLRISKNPHLYVIPKETLSAICAANNGSYEIWSTE